MTSLASPGGRLPLRIVPDRMQRVALKLADAPAVLRRRRFGAVRAGFYRAMWAEAAAAVGASAEDAPGGLTRISRGSLLTFVRRSDLMLDSALTVAALADKTQTLALLAHRGAPVPEHTEFSLNSIAAARRFLARHPQGVVVKPATGTGAGRGVTTRITTAHDLTRAARHAASFNRRLLVEPQLHGASFRMLYLDGELLDVVRRDPPQITGDGRASIRTLVRRENARRLEARDTIALSPLGIDRDARIHLAEQGLSPSSQPAKGQAITLKCVVNENGAAQNHSVRDAVHPEIADLGARLVRDLGVRCAGLDLIAPDLTHPLAETGGTVGEINVNPGLHHHYLIARPATGAPVATRILKHLFDTETGVMHQ